MSFYKDKRVLITGGLGFIGSHLAEKLVDLGANVTIVDNLSTGSEENIRTIRNKIVLINGDLTNFESCMRATQNQEIVFHLAAPVGGRGYIEEHPGECSRAFAINENLFRACLLNNVERIHFASSACVYPVNLQNEYGSKYLLKEEDADLTCPKECDTLYGWAKLTGEMQLKAYYQEYGLKSSIARYVTVYGPRENESHAIIALLLRAIRREDPYIIWGTGLQDRDFTFVTDIVEGSLLITEKVTNAEAYNLGTGEKYTINEVVEKIFNIVGWRPKRKKYLSNLPEGVKSRGLDISKSRSLGWYPKISLEQGIKITYEYLKKHRR